MKVRPWCAALAACVVIASACRREEPSRTDTQARGTTTTQQPGTTQPGQQPSTTRPGGVDRGTQPATAPRDQTGTTGGTKTDTTKTGQDTSKTGQTLTGLDPQVLATRARTMIQDVRMQIEGVDDAQGARQVVTRAQPMVDQLLDVRSELKSQNVDVSPLVTAANDAESRLAGNQDALDALKPLLDKVKQLDQP